MAKLPEEPTVEVGGVLRFVRPLPEDAGKGFHVDIDIAEGPLRAAKSKQPTGATIRVDPRIGRFPTWLRAVDALQRSARSPDSSRLTRSVGPKSVTVVDPGCSITCSRSLSTKTKLPSCSAALPSARARRRDLRAARRAPPIPASR